MLQKDTIVYSRGLLHQRVQGTYTDTYDDLTVAVVARVEWFNRTPLA